MTSKEEHQPALSHENISAPKTRSTRPSAPMNKISHAKSYSLLRLFIEHVGMPSTRGCYKLQPHRHAIDAKLMNWLLQSSNGSRNETGIPDCWHQLEAKLSWLLPILRGCNGDVNHQAPDDGRTILHAFVKDHVGGYKSSLPRESLLKILKLAKQLLQDHGASVNAVDLAGNTPLHHAATIKIIPLIRLLLDDFDNVDARNSDDGNAVLHILADSPGSAENFKQLVRSLLAKGADPNARNDRGNTPVHLAARHCLLETLDVLKSHGGDFSLLGERRKNVLHFVCGCQLRDSKDEMKKMKTIDFAVSEGLRVDEADEGGLSALHYAASCHNSGKVIQKLMKLGADVKRKTVKDEETPLHVAVKTDCAAIEALLKGGADIEATTARGVTPLHWAIIHGSVRNMDCLIKHGSDVRRRGRVFDLTPVHMSVLACNCKKKLDLLIDKGVDLNATTSKGITALHLAAMVGNVEAIETLVKHGVEVNRRDKIRGWTALHWAATRGGKFDASVLAVEEDPEDEYWKSVLDEASARSRNPIDILLKSGAYVDVRDSSGHTPLYYVVENDDLEGLERLLKHHGGVDVNAEDVSELVVGLNDGEVRHRVLWHAMKLRQLGFAIGARYKFSTYHTDYWCEYRKCLDEVVALKKHKIDGDGMTTSMYDFLHMSPEARYDYVEKVLLVDLPAKYPWYYDIIVARCREAVDRRLLMKPAKMAMRELTGLPQLCVEGVLSYLSNEKLRVIVDAAGKRND